MQSTVISDEILDESLHEKSIWLDLKYLVIFQGLWTTLQERKKTVKLTRTIEEWVGSLAQDITTHNALNVIFSF